MIYCIKCGTALPDDAGFCYKCGSKTFTAQKSAVNNGSASAVNNEPAAETVTKEEAPVDEHKGSSFTGGALAYTFIRFLGLLASIFTLSLARPAMLCWYYRWEAKHTYINGKQLVFTGKAGKLMGKYVLWVFLSVITLGIFYLACMTVSMEKWRVKNTHYVGYKEDDESIKSYFDGRSAQLFGVKLLTRLVSTITLSFGSYWAYCYKQKWFAKHTVYDGNRLTFNGRAIQYFGKRVLWTLLTIITFGVYGFTLAKNSKKWTVSHTFEEGNEVAESKPEKKKVKPENKNKEEEVESPNSKGKNTGIVGMVFTIIAGAFFVLLIVFKIISSTNTNNYLVVYAFPIATYCIPPCIVGLVLSALAIPYAMTNNGKNRIKSLVCTILSGVIFVTAFILMMTSLSSMGVI